MLLGCWSASVVAMFTADRYTSQVVIQARFARPQLLPITVADSVIQTEINFIRSRDIAEDVVTRLGLANDPNTVEHPSMLSRARALMTFWHSRPSSSATSRIAAELLKQLDVTNDPKIAVNKGFLHIHLARAVGANRQRIRAGIFTYPSREIGSTNACRSCYHLRPEAP